MSKSASSGRPDTLEVSPLLLHPAAEQALVAIGRVADELAKLNASMDKLIAAKGDAVRPAVEALAEQLIGFLDATAGDPDLGDELDLEVDEVELKGEADGDNGGCVDDEPSLGSLDGRFSQLRDRCVLWPPDLEEENEHGDGGADDEPSLGASDGLNQERAWSGGQNPTCDDREEQNEDGDDLDRLEASDLDISGESDAENGGGTVDDEPSLGSLDGRMSQLRWCQPDRSALWPNEDTEYDEAEHEVGIEDMPHDAGGLVEP
jgi:hypothetical protein